MTAHEPTPAHGRDTNPSPDDSDNDGAEIDGQRLGSIESAASQTRLLLIIAAAAGLAYGVSLRDAPYPDQAAAKVLMCALLFLATARHEPMRERLRLMIALAASAAGDALLALPQLSFSFVGGLGAFLVAHLAYCSLLAPRARRTEGWRRLAVPLLWAAAVAMYLVFFPHLGVLSVPVAVYMLALCTMATLAVIACPAGVALPIGGLAFVASDAMIGIDRFIGAFAGSAYAIWFSYAAAQLSIAAGVLLIGNDRR